MMDTYGICGVSETIEKKFGKPERERESDRAIDDGENIMWLKLDANCLLDVKDKNSDIYCTLPWRQQEQEITCEIQLGKK